MSIRRSHTKSRSGCRECRRRHVKCDEKQPSCSRCMQRDVTCHYALRIEVYPSARRSQLRAVEADELNIKTVQDAGPSTIDKSICLSTRPGELKLMHHWCTRTCYSFSPQLAELFRDHIGEVALRNEFLMKALLAVTSLHIASETRDVITSRAITRAALQYHSEAISGLRQRLHDITPSSCVALFACSAMIMVCAIVSPLLPTGLSDEIKSTSEAMLSVVDLMRGISSIIDVSRQWLLQGPLGEILRSSVPRKPSAIEKSFPAQELRELNNACLSNHCWMHDGRNKHRIFEDAILKLEDAFESGISMLPWLLKIDAEFMEELRKHDSMAVAIFMHWSVLLDRLDEMWWAKYSGKRLVRDLSETLDGRGEEWGVVTTWCRVQVGLNTST